MSGLLILVGLALPLAHHAPVERGRHRAD